MLLLHLLVDLLLLSNDHYRLGERHVVQGELQGFLSSPSVVLLDGLQLIPCSPSILMWLLLLQLLVLPLQLLCMLILLVHLLEKLLVLIPVLHQVD